MHAMALRIQNRAMRRAGELLKQVPRADANGANLVQHRQDGDVPPVTRTRVATDAGLSERQRKTALRVASVPEPDFERAVESASPPTVTRMAAAGTGQRQKASTLSEGDYPGATDATRYLRELSAFCATRDPIAVAAGVRDPDLMRGFVETIDRWLDSFITHLAHSDDEAA